MSTKVHTPFPYEKSNQSMYNYPTIVRHMPISYLTQCKAKVVHWQRMILSRTTGFLLFYKPPKPNPMRSLLNTFTTQTNPPFPLESNLKNLCLNGQLTEALLEMHIQGHQMIFHGYDSLLTLCINQKSIRGGQRVHTHLIKTRYLPPVYLDTRLIVLYTKCGYLKDARQVFDRMRERNVVSWTAMISAYAKRGVHGESCVLFNQMLTSGNL